MSKFDELTTSYDYLFQKQYRIDPFGVKLGSTDEAGNFKSDKVVSPKPILPTAILDNLDSEVQKVEIAWWESGRWKRTVTNRETLVNNSKITKLADRGVPVGSDNARVLSTYFNTMLCEFDGRLPRKPARSVMGWCELDERTLFMPYTDLIQFDGGDEYKAEYKAIRNKGTLEEWVARLEPLRVSFEVRLMMAASFASPLIGLIQENPFVFHLYGESGSGKAQPLDTKIITPYGYKLMRDIHVGDAVIGGDGNPHTVTGVFPQGEKAVYKVTLADGRSTKCCAEHLWNVSTVGKRAHGNYSYDVVNLGEMLKTGVKHGEAYRYSIPMCKPVEYADAQHLPIDPYLLGALIGDGCLTMSKAKSGARPMFFSNTEQDVVSMVEDKLSKYGSGCRLWRNKATQCEYTIRGDVRNLRNDLVSLGLNVKSGQRFIPDIYMTASSNDRMELLRGLFDTDGSFGKNGAKHYSTMSKRLAEDVTNLCWSLGMRASCKLTSKGYHVQIVTDQRVYNSNKHRERDEGHRRARTRSNLADRISIVNIEPCGTEECQCIMVDSEEHTYLCDDYIVTHNTVCMLLAMSIWGDPDQGKLLRSMNTTVNAMMERATFLNSLPFAGDELQTIKSRWTGTYDSLIMQITEGINRGRMKNNEVQEMKSWKCAFLFTGEEPCVKATSGGGVVNRCIQVEIKQAVFDKDGPDSGNKIANFARNHYGHAGRAYIERIMAIKAGLAPVDYTVKGLYDSYYSELVKGNTTEKQAGAMALMLTGDRIAHDLFWNGEADPKNHGEEQLTAELVAEYLATRNQVDVAKRAYTYLCGVIAENSYNFTEGSRVVWGKFDNGEKPKQVDFVRTVLERVLTDAGFDFDAIKKKWAANGYIVFRESARSYIYTTRICGVPTQCVRINLPNTEE